MSLDKNAILGANDTKTAEVECPEWGGSVRVRELRIKERMHVLDNIEKDKSVIGVWVVAKCAITADGEQLFDDADIELLSQKSAVVLDRIGMEVMKISGLTADADEAELKN